MHRIVMVLSLFALSAKAEVVEPQSCALNAPYAMLDFWLGDWEVFVGANLVGKNTIKKTMKGCAVLEHWQGSSGGRGMSLFYVDSQNVWKQVWVTEYGRMPGGVKEKTQQPIGPPTQVRFQGRVYAEDDKSYLDRTTLTSLPNGNVQQLIEVSMDEGATWKATFDAVYRRPAN